MMSEISAATDAPTTAAQIKSASTSMTPQISAPANVTSTSTTSANNLVALALVLCRRLPSATTLLRTAQVRNWNPTDCSPETSPMTSEISAATDPPTAAAAQITSGSTSTMHSSYAQVQTAAVNTSAATLLPTAPPNVCLDSDYVLNVKAGVRVPFIISEVDVVGPLASDVGPLASEASASEETPAYPGRRAVHGIVRPATVLLERTSSPGSYVSRALFIPASSQAHIPPPNRGLADVLLYMPQARVIPSPSQTHIPSRARFIPASSQAHIPPPLRGLADVLSYMPRAHVISSPPQTHIPPSPLVAAYPYMFLGIMFAVSATGVYSGVLVAAYPYMFWGILFAVSATGVYRAALRVDELLSSFLSEIKKARETLASSPLFRLF